MYIISQDEYERIVQNREGNLKIVPENAEPPSVDYLHKPSKVVEIDDGITKTEHQKDSEARAEKAAAEEEALAATLPPHAEEVVKSTKTPSRLKTQFDKIKRDPLKIVLVSGAALFLLYLIFVWKPASAK